VKIREKSKVQFAEQKWERGERVSYEDLAIFDGAGEKRVKERNSTSLTIGEKKRGALRVRKRSILQKQLEVR